MDAAHAPGRRRRAGAAAVDGDAVAQGPAEGLQLAPALPLAGAGRFAHRAVMLDQQQVAVAAVDHLGLVALGGAARPVARPGAGRRAP